MASAGFPEQTYPTQTQAGAYYPMHAALSPYTPAGPSYPSYGFPAPAPAMAAYQQPYAMQPYPAPQHPYTMQQFGARPPPQPLEHPVVEIRQTLTEEDFRDSFANKCFQMSTYDAWRRGLNQKRKPAQKKKAKK
eukprot:NODE_3918_length_893_cov_38.303318_g3606_i0.p1 GENE.NODE_3918_length_893_cov_38.303318_g3606_i0~~NODE_3918_length_893_cov_38.303318_g3606_i0.p1  ORF type:complete len:134 (-),score=20.38 NODE_3918_length_893_cov_38.303318_g3606_i0:419-820(-)